MNLEQKLEEAALDFSKNKATTNSYKKIFNLIYSENIIKQNNNEYGFTEIPAESFKLISKRKYKEILFHLYKNSLIYVNIPLSKNNTGRNKSGNKIIRGYKVERDLIDEVYVPPVVIMQIKREKPIKKIAVSEFEQNTFKNIEIFQDEFGNYNLEKIYNYINLDKEAIDYEEESEEYNDLIKKWNSHSNIKKSGFRYFSWFHSLKSTERSFFTINNSYLRECFDIPACNFCILAKMFESIEKIPEKELSKFQRIIKFKYIYKEIIEYAGLEFNELNKKLIKESCQHWLNIRKCKIKQGAFKDKFFNFVNQYFELNFPNIYDVIINWREEKYTNSSGKIRNTKMLWEDYQKVELEIITKLVNYLFKKYKVTPITVHDAVYLTDDDKEKVEESIEDIFWKIIDLKHIKKIFTKSEYAHFLEKLSNSDKCKSINEHGYLVHDHQKYFNLVEKLQPYIKIVPDIICSSDEEKEFREIFNSLENKDQTTS